MRGDVGSRMRSARRWPLAELSLLATVLRSFVLRLAEIGWPWVNKSTPMVPCWGRCTTHFRTYFCGDWDVHGGYGVLTHSQVPCTTLRGLSHL